MKPLLYVFWVVGLSFILGACAKPQNRDNFSGTLYAQLPWFNQTDASYSLQNIKIESIKSLKSLKGDYAKFEMMPTLSAGHISGYAPEIRYMTTKKNIVVATDFFSLQLLTVYAHLERLAALDKSVGAGNVNKWPRQVGVNVNFRDAGGSRIENNAVYSGAVDALLLVPYSQDDLPIAVNGGILAHEHFHSLFYKLVIAPLGDKYPKQLGQSVTAHGDDGVLKVFNLADARGARVNAATQSEDEVRRNAYNQVLLRGINEGFADVWGWIYTNDPQFIAYSLPSEKVRRDLNAKSAGVYSTTTIRYTLNQYSFFEFTDPNESKKFQGDLEGLSYQLGTEYSRVIKGFTDLYAKQRGLTSDQARQQIGAYLVKSLPVLRDDFAKIAGTDYLPAAAPLKHFMEQITDMKDFEKDFMLNSLPHEDTDPVPVDFQ